MPYGFDTCPRPCRRRKRNDRPLCGLCARRARESANRRNRPRAIGFINDCPCGNRKFAARARCFACLEAGMTT